MPVVLVGFLAAFLLLCLHYGAQVQLWGDESFGLAVAAQSPAAILEADPFHLPTYYLALHPLVSLFPAGLELPLRLLHALIFAVGLVFCWCIARSFLGEGWALWGVMGLTILLPNYIFYATNIRMYAPLFAASQAFLWTSFRLLDPGRGRRRPWVAHGLTALLCALVDWPGLMLVGLTWAALIALKGRSLLALRGAARLFLVALGGLALLGALWLREPLISLLLDWPSRGKAMATDFRLQELLPALFLKIRPLLDLVYPPVYPVPLNLLLWLLLGLALPVAAVVVWWRGEARHRLVVLLAFAWLVGSFLGVAITRAFLPAQFFMLLCLALALQRGGRARRLWAPWLWACLVAVGLANLQQAVAPTLRLYSRIPYPAIAQDAVAAARDRGLPLIALSRHSLNALSVERFARPRLANDQELRLLDVRPDCASFPRGTFVYVQLTPEDGEDSDPVRICADQTPVQVQTLRTYVDRDALAYNRLWLANLKGKGFRQSAAQLHIVTIPAQ